MAAITLRPLACGGCWFGSLAAAGPYLLVDPFGFSWPLDVSL